MFSLIIIALLALIIGIFVYQNWVLVPPVVFLGLQSKSLPLALLVVFAFTLGLMTVLFISLLNNLVINNLQAEIAALENAETTTETEPTSNQTNAQKSYSYSQPINNDASDWENFDNRETNPNTAEDWEEVINDLETNQQQSSSPPNKPRTAAVYSYSYRAGKNSPSTKSDKVYDADYRVIKPPEQPKTGENSSDWEAQSEKKDDEWDF